MSAEEMPENKKDYVGRPAEAGDLAEIFRTPSLIIVFDEFEEAQKIDLEHMLSIIKRGECEFNPQI
jgi:hypothetical protein